MIGMMNRLEIMESIDRLNNPGDGLSILMKTWKDLKKFRNEIKLLANKKIET